MTLFAACALTVLIEVPFLALFGFRSRYALTVTVCTNIVTNLTLNLCLRLFPPASLTAVLLAEAAVVAAEYGIYRTAFGRSWDLLLLTASANLLSFGLGLLIF